MSPPLAQLSFPQSLAGIHGSYIKALRLLYLVEPVPPWTNTDYAQVGRQRKLFLTDSGLMASVLGWPMNERWLNPDQVGKIFETFVFNELAAQVDAEETRAVSTVSLSGSEKSGKSIF